MTTHAKRRRAGRFLRELAARAARPRPRSIARCIQDSVDAFFAESRALQHPHDRRQGADGPQRAGGAARHRRRAATRDSKALIERWHGRGRQLYCDHAPLRPLLHRGPARSGRPALARASRHLCAVASVREPRRDRLGARALPGRASSYLDVYDHAGLTGPRAIFGHAVHMDEDDFACCHRTGSALAHCPTSNLFLGSGLFRMFEAKRADRPVRVALGTDLGAGTSFSPAPDDERGLQGRKARRHDADAGAGASSWRRAAPPRRCVSRTASARSRPAMRPTSSCSTRRRRRCSNSAWPIAAICRTLSVLMTLGDDRAIRATYIAGEPVYDRDRPEPFVYPHP